jgi:hypothetical protein
MTSFSLLKFKFTQIFLIGQNRFSKMTIFFEKLVDNSVNSIKFCVSTNFLFLSHVRYISTKFSQFSAIFFSNFTKYDGFNDARIFLSRPTLEHWLRLPPDAVTLSTQGHAAQPDQKNKIKPLRKTQRSGRQGERPPVFVPSPHSPLSAGSSTRRSSANPPRRRSSRAEIRPPGGRKSASLVSCW